MAEYEYSGVQIPILTKNRLTKRQRLKKGVEIPPNLQQAKSGQQFEKGDVLYVKWHDRITGVQVTKVEFLGSNKIV